jgi:hypothetical protein
LSAHSRPENKQHSEDGQTNQYSDSDQNGEYKPILEHGNAFASTAQLQSEARDYPDHAAIDAES